MATSKHGQEGVSHTRLTAVAYDENSLNNCRHRLELAFRGLLQQYRQHEETTNLSSSSIQISYHCEFIRRGLYDPDDFSNKFIQSCRLWCKLTRGKNMKLWVSTDMEEAFMTSARSATVHTGIKLKSFSLGSMYDRWTFVEHYKHTLPIHTNESQATLVNFEHDSRFMTISFHSAMSVYPSLVEYTLRVRYDDLQELILVDDKGNATFDVYFMLKIPPSFHRVEHVGKNVNRIRVTRTSCCTTETIGDSSILSLAVTNEFITEFQRVISRFHAFRFKVYWSHINTCPVTPAFTKPRFESEFEMTYALECLLSLGYLITYRVLDLYKMLNNLSPGDYPAATKALQQLALQVDPALDGDRFINLADTFQNNFQDYKTAESDDTEEKYDNCKYVRRAVVTPTRCLLLPPELMAENRILRQCSEDLCMRVVFRDENFTKLGSFETSQGEEITRRIKHFLTIGVHIDDRHYQFLACSNSQLRDHGCWLLTKDSDGRSAKHIRQWMGDFSNIRCVATYISRMGQCFSTSEESVKVSVEAGQVEREEDIQSLNGNYCFSDGIGRVSVSLAGKIATVVNKKVVPSAYQIRYAGCKGVVAIDPTIEGDKLIFRKSMEKFQSSHEEIEIMNNTKPCRLFLNRPAITLLSGLGIPDNVFKELQESMLYELGRMFFYDNVAAESLSRRASRQTAVNYRQVAAAGVSLTTEPFFRGLLLAVYRNLIGQLQRRARIEIPSVLGRNMIGVLDETGELNYGQVFVQYSQNIDKPQKEKIVHVGQVAVTKFPALHPGDFRKFNAVDVQVLHHMVDCIVFPRRGKRPHPNEMAGSDLDGDEYFVTWMHQLIFDEGNKHPMDFTAPPKKIHNGPIEVQDMIHYIADYIKNDNVGLIANAHLAQADYTQTGIFSHVCIKIAEIFAKAVDFAKTGYSPDLHKDLRPNRYPDFMGKRDKTSYMSNKILGDLFRQCRQIDRIAIHQKESNLPDVPYDLYLTHPGWQRYQKQAESSLSRYNRQLEAILRQYGITSESEALSGNIGRLSKRLTQRNEIHDAKNIITLKVKHLWNKTKNTFFEEFGGRDAISKFPDESLAKASAWYMTTYNQKEKKYLSFPWVVADVLCDVRINALTQLVAVVTSLSVMRRFTIESQEHSSRADDEGLYRSVSNEPLHANDLPLLSWYLRNNPWLRCVAGVLIIWRRRRALTNAVGKIELMVLLIGFAINKKYICPYRNQSIQPLVVDEDETPAELLVEFFFFCSSRNFYKKEHRHVPPTFQHPKFSKRNLKKISAAAEKAYHQLALCGTVQSILQADENPNEEIVQMTMVIDNNLYTFYTIWQNKLKEEFPRVELLFRRLGGGRRSNTRISLRGPFSQVYEVQDRIEEWQGNPQVFQEDTRDLDDIMSLPSQSFKF